MMDGNGADKPGSVFQELEKGAVELDRIPDPREFVEQSAATILKQVGTFPSAQREAAALERLRVYFRTCGEFLARFEYAPLHSEVNKLARDLRALTVPEPIATGEEEVSKHSREFLEIGYRSIEVTTVGSLLRRGEEILAILPRSVKTSQCEIDRYGLRLARPVTIRSEPYISQWEQQFPSAAEIDECARRVEAPPRPAWSPE